jgi:hypothetical protein
MNGIGTHTNRRIRIEEEDGCTNSETFAGVITTTDEGFIAIGWMI